MSSSAESESRSVAILGAGLAGSLLAVQLAKRGYRVDVYERRPDSRLKDSVWEGKSINLALSERGRKALRDVGLDDEVTSRCVKMSRRAMHDAGPNAPLRFMQYGSFATDVIYSMERRMLNEKLMDKAENEGAKFHFRRKVQQYDVRRNRVVLEAEGGADGDAEVLTPDIVIGADGAFSKVRKGLATLPLVNFSQQYLDHGYKELSIQPTEDGDWSLKPVDALHIWPRGEFMMIALPNPDKSWTVTLFMPWKGEEGFDNLRTDEQVRAFFNKYFPDVIPLMPHLLEEFRQNAAAPLVTMRLFPWHYKDYCVVLGDAAHAIVPFYGQGMNASLEDVDVLKSLLDDFDQDWEKALAEFSRVRKPQGDAISDLSHRNYIEMRSKVNSTWFLMRQKFDRFLHRILGHRWLPLYEMVAFKTMPYTEAIATDAWQSSFFSRVLSVIVCGGIATGLVGAAFAFRHYRASL